MNKMFDITPLERGIKLLRLIERSHYGINAAQMMKEAGIPRRSLYRLLQRLITIEPIYTERRGKEVFYKFLRDEQ